jgi:hypothetical protein
MNFLRQIQCIHQHQLQPSCSTSFNSQRLAWLVVGWVTQSQRHSPQLKFLKCLHLIKLRLKGLLHFVWTFLPKKRGKQQHGNKNRCFSALSQLKAILVVFAQEVGERESGSKTVRERKREQPERVRQTMKF